MCLTYLALVTLFYAMFAYITLPVVLYPVISVALTVWVLSHERPVRLRTAMIFVALALVLFAVRSWVVYPLIDQVLLGCPETLPTEAMVGVRQVGGSVLAVLVLAAFDSSLRREIREGVVRAGVVNPLGVALALVAVATAGAWTFNTAKRLAGPYAFSVADSYTGNGGNDSPYNRCVAERLPGLIDRFRSQGLQGSSETWARAEAQTVCSYEFGSP